MVVAGIERVFCEEGYSDRYGVFGGRGASEPEFEVVEILNAQLEEIGLSFAMTVDDLSEVERLSEVAETWCQGMALSFYTSLKSHNLVY